MVLPELDSDYHFILNPDIQLTADTLSDLADWMEQHPELQAQRDEERNQLKLELARLLAEQGFKTEVWATKTVEDYGEKQYYICFLTATPAQLWALETLTEISPVFIEPQYESVRLRLYSRKPRPKGAFPCGSPRREPL